MTAMAVALSLASCSTSQKVASLASLSGEWDIVELNGKAVTAAEGQDTPFIGFDTVQERVYGSTGCNRLTGKLVADAGKQTIDFGALGCTRMMCKDMETEQQVLTTLGEVHAFKLLKDGQLALCDGGKQTVMLLRHRAK